MKITILVNTLNTVNAFIYGNHINFFTKAVKAFPEIEFNLFTPYRMAIDTARNNAAKIALETESDYLLFLDDDVMVPPDGMKYLLEDDKDIVAGLVIIRGLPFNVMAFKEVGPGQLSFYNELPLVESCMAGHTGFHLKCSFCEVVKLQDLVECGAVGFSLCLIKTSILKAMEPPFFITGVVGTEDVYFCLKAKNTLQPEPKVYLDTRIKCGHLLNAEPIEWGNRRQMQELYTPVKKQTSHGIEYIDKCLAKV